MGFDVLFPALYRLRYGPRALGEVPGEHAPYGRSFDLVSPLGYLQCSDDFIEFAHLSDSTFEEIAFQDRIVG